MTCLGAEWIESSSIPLFPIPKAFKLGRAILECHAEADVGDCGAIGSFQRYTMPKRKFVIARADKVPDIFRS